MRKPTLSHVLVFALVSSALVFVPPASLGSVHAATITLDGMESVLVITRPGMYGIRYTWLNDRFECTDPHWKPGDECGASRPGPYEAPRLARLR